MAESDSISSPILVAQTCPRCAYDLSAIPPSWSDACPLTGTCSECGYAYLWRDILNPLHSVPSRFFEHANSLCIRALATTYFRSFRAHTFWTWLRLPYRIKTSRLFVYLLSILPLAYGISTAIRYALYRLYVEFDTSSLWGLSGYGADFHARVLMSGTYSRQWAYAENFLIPLAFWIVWCAALPLSYNILVSTLSRARIAPSHLLRIGAYWLCIAIPLIFGITLIEHALATTAWLDAPFENIIDPLWDILPTCAILIPAIYSVHWWTAANKRYLEIKHPFATSLLLNIIAGMAALTFYMYTKYYL